MTMPFLPIDSTIVSNPSRHHLAIIKSWMLWPDDEAKRLDAFTSEVVAMGHDLKRQGKLDPATLDELFELAVNAKPIGQTFEMEPYKHGMMAGHVLIAAIEGKDVKGGPLKLGDINKKLTKKFARHKTDNSSFGHTIWQKYHSVSHLWAAHINFTTSNDYRFFPCELRDIIEFLWLSEDWRHKGESTKTHKKAPSTILRPGECVRIPETMKFSGKDWNT
jgi:hypothetical protein